MTDASRLSMPLTIRLALLSVGTFALGLVIYCVAAPEFSVLELLRVQLGAGFQPLPLPTETRQVFLWDFAFILCYLLSLWWVARLAPMLFRGARAQAVRRWLRRVVVIAAAADVLENLLVLGSLVESLPDSDVRAILNLAAHAAIVKFLCFAPAFLLGCTLVIAALVRRPPAAVAVQSTS